MLSTSELLKAAKSGRGIPSNYRLARVMGLSDQTIFRWHSGAGSPDDLHAAKLAEMAGLDVEYVVVSMKAEREKDPALRAIWARAAERLLLTTGMPPQHDGGGAPPGGSEPESGGPTDDESASDKGALMSSDESHIMRSSTPTDARLRRIAKASLGRVLRAKKAH